MQGEERWQRLPNFRFLFRQDRPSLRRRQSRSVAIAATRAASVEVALLFSILQDSRFRRSQSGIIAGFGAIFTGRAVASVVGERYGPRLLRT
jgi:hypothetical protein